MTSKVSLRHFGTSFSTTSASTTSSTAALTVSTSPSATSRTRIALGREHLREAGERGGIVAQQPADPVPRRQPAARRAAGSKVLQARI